MIVIYFERWGIYSMFHKNKTPSVLLLVVLLLSGPVLLMGVLVQTAEPAQPTTSCPIFDLKTGEPITGNADHLALLLASTQVCPTDVFEFRDLLLSEDVQLTTTMVANRGFHNPAFGSFSLFEMVEGELPSINKIVEKGEFFFGHFIGAFGS